MFVELIKAVSQDIGTQRSNCFKESSSFIRKYYASEDNCASYAIACTVFSNFFALLRLSKQIHSNNTLLVALGIINYCNVVPSIGLLCKYGYISSHAQVLLLLVALCLFSAIQRVADQQSLWACSLLPFGSSRFSAVRNAHHTTGMNTTARRGAFVQFYCLHVIACYGTLCSHLDRNSILIPQAVRECAQEGCGEATKGYICCMCVCVYIFF